MMGIVVIGALIPAVMFIRNLSAYRRLPRSEAAAAPSERRVAHSRGPVSGLEFRPRDEEGSIRAAVEAALANGHCEVLVGDDHSTDRTAASHAPYV